MKNITIKAKWIEILSKYPVSLKGEVYSAVVQYLSTGTVPELSASADVAFSFIRYEIDTRKKAKSTTEPSKPATPTESVESPKTPTDPKALKDLTAPTPTEAPATAEVYTPKQRQWIAGLTTSISRARSAGVPPCCAVVKARPRSPRSSPYVGGEAYAVALER
ncbi:MAG: hypothetical protein HFJ94_06555 [Muribaculaceae bacterium]|nr:hypothetical protein [Muribaculaceae bacterium]